MKYMNPGDMIANAKKKRDMLGSILVLVAASIVFAVSAAMTISTSSVLASVSAVNMGTVAVAVFGMVFLGGLFLGWLLSLAANVLGTKGGFFEGLTSVAYALLYLSMGFLLSGLFALTSNPFLMLVASFVSVMTFGVIGYMTMFRAVRDLFGVDMITTFIIVTVVMSVAGFSFYALIFSSAFAGSLSTIGGLGSVLI